MVVRGHLDDVVSIPIGVVVAARRRRARVVARVVPSRGTRGGTVDEWQDRGKRLVVPAMPLPVEL